MKYLVVKIRPKDTAIFIDPPEGLIAREAPCGNCYVYCSKEDTPTIYQGWEMLPDLKTCQEKAPDYLILAGNLHYETDIQSYLQQLSEVCGQKGRMICLYYSALWKPLIILATMMGLRSRQPESNWLAPSDVQNFATLADMDVVSRERRILMPFFLPLLSWLANTWLSQLPLYRSLTMIEIDVLRPNTEPDWNLNTKPSVTVVVPARNESGNIEDAFKRIPVMGPNDELIFVEGNSTDDTWDEIQRCKKAYEGKLSGREVKILKQPGKGKKDAVYTAFDIAERDILMILDADLTVPPEDLPKFYNALVQNKAEFVNGCRLVYPMEKEAMRFLNMCANKFFGIAFTFVLGQPVRDTLCGTKVYTREVFAKMMRDAEFFGDFDPFGDFDMLFGAARPGLKIIEVPVYYRARVYGDTNINRFSDGIMLFKMLGYAACKLRFV